MARNFDGVDDVINCGSSASLGDINVFTYTAWIFPNTFGEGSFARIINKSASPSTGKFFNVHDNTSGTRNSLHLLIDTSGTDAEAHAADNSIVTGAWQFVAASFDSSLVPRLYRGTPSADVAELSYASQVTGTGSVNTDATYNLLIGNRDNGTRTFDGRIADVRIFNIVLSLSELLAVQRGLIVRPEKMIGWWPLFGEQSPEPDWSGNNNHGTVTGAIRADHPPGVCALWPNVSRVLRAPGAAETFPVGYSRHPYTGTYLRM